MRKGGASGKAYHVKKEQKRKKKRDKDLEKIIARALGGRI